MNQLNLKNKTMEWISVEDRLPENSTYVLFLVDSDIMFQVLYGLYTDIGKVQPIPMFMDTEIESIYTTKNNNNDGKVTHWMPLPEPPRNIHASSGTLGVGNERSE